MTPSKATSGAPADDLLAGELIDSRALASASDDRFRHADLVAELVALVRTVPTPANVALFAPWGSGKSGMGNLLAAGLEVNSNIRFVKFDASKFGQAPLRRHFISQVAKGLGHRDDEFSKDLYRAVEDRRVKFPSKDLLALGAAFLVTLVGTVLLLLLLAFIAALLSSGGLKDNWSHVVKDFLLPALPLAAFVTIFVKMAGDGLTVKSVRSAPSGDEEFERLFRRLVSKTIDGHHVERIVVFVDELDRCSAAEVASTLETIKTFLEVEGCVFVVAADHQVLERALRKRARQETPVDPTNPYYSAGSSYLDKIFQYQYQLPPLKSRRLTEFALELVQGRSGVWQRVENLPEVVSVLIPTHVTSPRRVKVLLNSFALNYRLAERRASEGVLDSHLPARASEVAKLVCLRCEFPLFAEDLTMDTRLPSLVRAIADGEPIDVTVRPEVVASADAYAHGLLPVAEYLAEDGASTRSTPATTVTTELGADEKDDASEAEATNDELDDLPIDASHDSDMTAVATEHAQQLVRYLRKVAHIPGPASDLIYLESAGALVGLAPEVADDLERAAVDGDHKLVLDLVNPLDEAGRRSAIKLLAGLVREAPVGVEGQNVVSTLLSTISHTSLRLADVAGEVANAVAGHQRQIELRPEDLSGALILGLDSGSEIGDRLRDEVLSNQTALGRRDVAAAAICRAANVPDGFDNALGRAAATLLTSATDDILIDALQAIPDEQASRVLRNTLEPLREAWAAESSDEGSEDDSVVKNIATRLDVVTRGLRDNNQTQAMITAITIAVSSGQVPLQQAAFHYLADLEPISDQGLVGALMDIAPKYETKGWPNIIGRIDPAALPDLPDTGPRLGRAATTLWNRAVREGEAKDSKEQLDAGLNVLEKLTTKGAAVDRDALREAIAGKLVGAFTTDADSEAQKDKLTTADRFVTAGMLDKQVLADLDLNCCIATLEASRPADSETQQVPEALYRRVIDATSIASSDVLQQLADKIAPTEWWTEAQKVAAQVFVSAGRHRYDAEIQAPLSPNEFAEIRVRDGEAFDPALARWLAVFEPSPQDIWTALVNLASGPLPQAITEVLQARASTLSAGDKFVLAKPALNDPERSPGSSFLRAIHFSEADQGQVAAEIERIATQSDTPSQRELALVLWGEYKPTRQATQDRLVDNVYLPLVRRAGADLDIAVSHFGLVAGRRGKARSSITDALRDSSSDDEQQKRIEERLKEAGWLKRSGLFGRGPVVETDDR